MFLQVTFVVMDIDLEEPTTSTQLMSIDRDQKDVEDIDTYFFESDHVALKGNPDYHALLRTIALLEAQRIQAVADLNKLHKCKEEALHVIL